MRQPTGSTGLLLLLLAAGCKGTSAPPPAALPAPARPPEPIAAAPDAGPRRVALQVTTDGFQPDSLRLKAGEPVVLVVTRVTDQTCATELLIEGTELKVKLPINSPVEVAYTPPRAGKVKFGCAMEMMVSGVLLVE